MDGFDEESTVSHGFHGFDEVRRVEGMFLELVSRGGV